MSLATSGFRVVTEFVFNANQAVAGAEELNSKIDMLSKSADAAINSVSRLGLSYAFSFSGAGGGILGLLGGAIKSADKFKGIQIELASAMISNSKMIKENSGGANQELKKSETLMRGLAGASNELGNQKSLDTGLERSALSFKDAMIKSNEVMSDIIKKSREFGISPDAFASQVKFFNAMLAPKGLSGENLENPKELARVSMKAAETLGVSEQQTTSGIMAGISGQLSRQTQFGTRLFMEAGDVIQMETGIKNLKEFNKAIPSKRIRAMVVGLDKLAGSSKIVDARAMQLSNQMQTLAKMFGGIGNILIPLGAAVTPILQELLGTAINFLKKEGVEIVDQITIFSKNFIKGPKELLIDMVQVSKLSSDIAKSIGIGGIAVSLGLAAEHIADFYKFIARKKGLRGLALATKSLIDLTNRVPIVGNVLKSFSKMFHVSFSGGIIRGFGMLGKSFIKFGGLVGVLLIPLQGLSRAMGRIKFDNFESGVKAIPKLMKGANDAFSGFKMIFSPIQDLIEGWEQLFVSMIGGGKDSLGIMGTVRAGWNLMFGSMSEKTEAMAALAFNYGDSIASLGKSINEFGKDFLELWASFKGLIAGSSALLGLMTGGKAADTVRVDQGLKKDESIGIGNIWDQVVDTFMGAGSDEFNKTMDRQMTPTIEKDGEFKKESTTHNNYKVTMNNNFKEVLQPDRIAFTIQDQLEKASANRKGTKPKTTAGMQALGF